MTDANLISKYSDDQNKLNNKPLKSLYEKLAEAKVDNDLKKIEAITKLLKEIEKLILIKELKNHDKLYIFYKNDINMVLQDGSYHLIEMILQKEIDLMLSGDFKSIEMLNNIKLEAQKKIEKLNLIFIQNQQKKENASVGKPLTNIYIEKPSSYKPMIAYEGYHFEKTLGGEFIEVLDPDIKILVGTDIVNSKPQDLSTQIINDIKNIRRGSELSEDSQVLAQKPPTVKNNKIKDENKLDLIKGKWTDDLLNNNLNAEGLQRKS